MKVAVFGSISIARLLPAELGRVKRLVELGAAVLLSDAPGVDLAVQRILADADYRNVVVYHRGQRPRNNVGAWPTIAVPGSYTDKDRTMCGAADCALAFWDGSSRGTRRNLEQLKREGKPVRLVTRGRGVARR
jgi:hypothetical protein